MGKPVTVPSSSFSKPVVADRLSPAPKVSITLHGRDYYVTCGAGEEQRLAEIVGTVDALLDDIATRNPGMTESRLFMMACLMLADEMIETKRAANEGRREEEEIMVSAVEHLQARVAMLAQIVGQA